MFWAHNWSCSWWAGYHYRATSNFISINKSVVWPVCLNHCVCRIIYVALSQTSQSGWNSELFSLIVSVSVCIRLSVSVCLSISLLDNWRVSLAVTVSASVYVSLDLPDSLLLVANLPHESSSLSSTSSLPSSFHVLLHSTHPTRIHGPLHPRCGPENIGFSALMHCGA